MKKIFTLISVLMLLCSLNNISQAQTLVADAGTDQIICSGQSVQIGGSPTATGGTPSYTYAWSSSPAGFSSTLANPVVSPVVTTIFTVTITDALSNTATDQVLVTVNPPPVADAGSSQSICFGGCATITASGGTSYQWSTGGASPSIIVCPAITTTYTVTVANGGCSASDNVVITVLQNPNATINATPSSICPGDNSVITAGGGVSYLWSTGATTSSIIVNPVATTSYNVTVTSASGCTATESTTVTVTGLGNPSVSASPDSVCSGASSILTALGGVNYQWSTGASVNSITVNPITTTIYYVTISDGCGNSFTETVTVVVQSNPTAEAGPDVSICPGGNVMLQASGGVSYAWSPATGLSATNISNPSASPSETTVYYVTATSSCGAAADSVMVTVTASGTLIANAGIDYNINPGSCVWLGSNPGATGGTPPYSFVWSDLQTGQYIQVCPTSTLIYTVTVSDAGGCVATDQDLVNVYSISNRISGVVFLDENANGIQDNGEPPYGGVVVKKVPSGNYAYVPSGTTDGIYNFYITITSAGDYTISIPSTSPFYTVTPSSYNVNISTSGQNDTLNNFAFCPMPNVKELEINNFVWGMPPRPGFTYGIRLDYK
ncbi:MAG: SdrD B-like domain-containing protein, partial [Bacteroidota bacterium]